MVIPGHPVAQHLRSDINSIQENASFKIIVGEVRVFDRHGLFQDERFQVIARDIIERLSNFGWNDRLQSH